MRCAPTAGVALVLCAATAGLLSAQGHPTPAKPPSRFASWEEVNVLAHGLLQLGHGLREHVERTRGQLGALERRLGACGAACEEPGAPAAPPHDPTSLVSRSEAASETLRSLQTQLKAQNSRIEQLFQKVAQQQRHLEKQHLKIQNLQSQVGLLAPMHLDHGVGRPARRKRLPKMSQLVGPVHNISHLRRLPRDCQELFEEGERQSGLFQIQPQGSLPFLANCRMTSDGGWTIIQRRQDGSVDFNQSWEAYKTGFGDPQAFSTWDQDHDLRRDKNCAKNLSGGWWFGTCVHSNLNGQYFHSIPQQRQQRKKGIFWKTWRGRYYPLQATTMLIQPTVTQAAS
ncbi:angiopoietin-related protein 4 isoform X2 [Saccopteryx leptura]|uniref:angiopoietin-related protein 4 isoform X2 n=1 Tax=Saccopteryx leptura TaxID=249018 RepID=UPI00339D126E